MPSKRQRDIWNLEKQAQAAGFAAARPGNRCEDVDTAARGVVVAAGFGPGYATPACLTGRATASARRA